MRPTLLFLALAALAALAATAADAAAQRPAGAALSREEITALAKAQVAINQVHDSIDAKLAQVGNKKPEAQAALQEQMRKQIAEVLHHNGLTEQAYRQRTFLVSTDQGARKTFDSVVVAITGAPLPGAYTAPPGTGRGNTPVPAGPVGTHLGHVINSFGDTPNAMGLLPVAMAEAATAAQHAALAMRQPMNLDYMKTHAGHVLNALDPTIVPAGPGLRYGLRKAAAGVVSHIELAAAAAGASANVALHAKHVATAARNTILRADQLVALAQQIQAATTAEAAAALTSQMASLAAQLVPGADANADGRITWDVAEGGLQHADEHVKLLLAGER